MRTGELTGIYRSKSDEELLVLAASEGLTAEAQLVLRNELKRRGMDAEIRSASQRTEPVPSFKSPETASTGHSVLEFTAAVARLYKNHLALFLMVTVPAIAVGYVVITLARQEGLRLAQDVFRYGKGNLSLIAPVLLKVNLLNAAAQLIAGLVSCFSFAVICAAVSHIAKKGVATIVECVSSVRERIGRILRLSLLFMMCVWLAIILAEFAMWCFFTFFRVKWNGSFVLSEAIGWLTASLCLLVVSRFALAMPAVVLDNYKVGAALFRSDELTEGKWLTLAALLFKSVFGGYLAAMLPFWFATLIWRYIALPGWFLTLLSYLGVTLVEPFMFIGFALLYVRMTSQAETPFRERASVALTGR